MPGKNQSKSSGKNSGKSPRKSTRLLLTGLVGCCAAGGFSQTAISYASPATRDIYKTQAEAGSKQQAEKTAGKLAAKDKHTTLPSGTPRVWEDRGMLTPAQVFWGKASGGKDPASRLPAPPFSDFQPDAQGTSPKCRLTDKNGVKWTVKFGEEVHADVAAPRLAWALGYGVDEDYYVKTGKIEGLTADTDLGRCKTSIAPDGTFAEARFKRHDKQGKHAKGVEDKDENDADATWDERKNPGLPPEQFSGLLILEVMVHNWDAQPKNNKIVHREGANGPENWFIVSDWGASFGQMKSKGNLTDYEKETSFIKGVTGDTVLLKFEDIIKGMVPVHEKIPLAHAQWFRKQLEKLTDADIRAAFQAAYAGDAVNQAYAAGQPADNSAFDPLTVGIIDGYVKTFRAKIDEFKAKVQ